TTPIENVRLFPDGIYPFSPQKDMISELVITQPDGSRYIYGLPVKNTYQEESSFSVKPTASNSQFGLIDHPSGDYDGFKEFLSEKTIPSEYSASWLLIGVVS